MWDLNDLGLQATQRITSAADPLALLAEISQNFPALVSSLSRQQVNDTLRRSMAKSQQALAPGASYLLLNGLLVDTKDCLDIYGTPPGP